MNLGILLPVVVMKNGNQRKDFKTLDFIYFIKFYLYPTFKGRAKIDRLIDR